MKLRLNSLSEIRTGLIGFCIATILAGFTSGHVWAHEDHDEEKKLPPHEQPHRAEPPTGGHKNLAEAATNPIANLIQFQVQNSYSPSNHNSSGYSNVTVLQPVIPIKLPWEKVPLLITRTTLPYITTPDFDGPEDRKRGFGDTTFLGLFSPKLETKGVQVGLGPTLVIPTAGDNEFVGSGKWQAGPSALYINMQTPSIQWGLFAFHLWDFADSNAGPDDRQHVSKLSLQPFITKHLNDGWYVGSPDVPQTYDFNTDKWTWALGPQVGKVTKLGKMPVKIFGALYFNPEDEAGPTAEWTAKVGITFLFPK
jgi:hypothetical protein